MDGSDTLAIEVSSTFMKVASDSATVTNASFAPVNGGRPARAPLAGPRGRGGGALWGVASTFMKVASDSATVTNASFAPVNGGRPAGAPLGAPPAAGLSAFWGDMRGAPLQAPSVQVGRPCRQVRIRQQTLAGARARGGGRRRRLLPVGGNDRLHARIGQRIARAEHIGRPRHGTARQLRQ